MVILPHKKIAVVHIPRTAGTSLAKAIIAADPQAVWMQSHEWMHASAMRAKQAFGDDWRTMAVIRSPWDIYRSRYGWALRCGEMPEKLHPKWFRQAVQTEAAMDFPQLVLHCIKLDILDCDGGFLRRYCDGETTVFQYEQTPWCGITDWLGIDLTPGLHNETIHDLPNWDRNSVELIATRCHNDIEQYGYLPPEI